MSIRPAFENVARTSAPPPSSIGGPSPSLSRRTASTASPSTRSALARSAGRPRERTCLGVARHASRVLALHVRHGRVVQVERVPVLHDVVHGPAHDDVAGVPGQAVGEPVLVLGRVVVVEPALRIGVHAVGGEDDVELHASHGTTLPQRPSNRVAPVTLGPMDPLDGHLATMLGPAATFRDGQREAIEAVARDGAAGARRAADRLGQEPRLLDRDPRPARRGPRPDPDHQPAAVADAQPDRDGRAPRPARGDDQLRQHRRVGGGRARPRGRRDRRPAHLAGAPRQRAVRARTSCRASSARSACSSSTRRTASPTGATTSGPTTGGSRRSCARSTRASRSWRRRPRPTTGSSPTSSPSSATASQVFRGPLVARLAPARRDPARRTRPSAWPGSPSRLPRAAGQRHRLLPDRRRHAARRHVPAGAGDRRPAVQRGPHDRGARGARGRADRERDEGAGRDGRARDGLRQARPRLRRPLPAARLGDRLLPAGRAGRAGGRRWPTACSSAAARTTTSPTTSWTTRSRRRSTCTRSWTPSRRPGR